MAKRKKRNKQKKYISKKEIANQFADDNRKKMTPAAKHFKKLLTKAGIRFKSEKIIYKTKSFYLVDFYIPERSLCIELDGGYHNEPEQRQKDRERDKLLEVRGYNNWRMTNEEALGLTKEDVITKIETYPKKETIVRIIPYEAPKYGKLKKNKKLKGNPRPPRRSKKKSKPIKTSYPVLDRIAENKARREQQRLR